MNIDPEIFKNCAASLAAAISLLERGGKRAAPSDKMFKQMLVDYKKSLRAATDAWANYQVSAVLPQPCKCLKPECIECHPAN